MEAACCRRWTGGGKLSHVLDLFLETEQINYMLHGSFGARAIHAPLEIRGAYVWLIKAHVLPDRMRCINLLAIQGLLGQWRHYVDDGGLLIVKASPSTNPQQLQALPQAVRGNIGPN